MTDNLAPPDRKVIQCNYGQATNVALRGARAYLVHQNLGNGNDRVKVLVFSRGHRWVEKWESTRRLVNFRIKTIPPEHPLYRRCEHWVRPEYFRNLTGDAR